MRRGAAPRPGSHRSTLTLATSSPALLSSGVRTVVAHLDGKPLLEAHPDSPAKTVNPAADTGFFHDPGAIVASFLWGLLLVWACRRPGPTGARRGSRGC